MYERMLDKNTIPDEVTVREHLGEDSHNRLADMG
jgi:hypothetical protein